MIVEPFFPHPGRALIEQLMERRAQTGADLDAIDAEIWQHFGCEQAVLYTDLVGFSRRVEAFGIIHFLQIIHESRRLLGPEISRFGGRVVKEEGDSLLITFDDPLSAVQSALAMHQAVKDWSQDKAAEDRIELCIGLGWGWVLKIGEVDVFGAEVNAACKLGEDRARGGESLASSAFAAAVEGRGPWQCQAVEMDFLAARRAWRIEPVT